MDATTFKQLQQVGQVLHAAREPVQFGDDHGVDFAALNQGQVLPALAGVDDDLDEGRLLERGHGPNPALLGGQADTLLRLPRSTNADVSDCFHL